MRDDLKTSARVYTDEEFAALISSLTIADTSYTTETPLRPSFSVRTPSIPPLRRPTSTQAARSATPPSSPPTARPATPPSSPQTARPATPLSLPQTAARPTTPPPSLSSSVYYFNSPTRRGYTSSWALAGALTQGVPGAYVRAVNKTSKRRTKKAAYVVFFGRVPGVFLTWDETQLLVNRVKNTIFRGYSTVNAAQAAYAYAHAMHWTRICGSALPASPAPLPTLPSPTMADNLPNPLHGSEPLDERWYVVYRGVLPGVYSSLLEALLNTVGIPNALYEGVEDREAAVLRYNRARDDGSTGVVPPPIGGLLDLEARN
ncbi:hypothetical protein C8R46DRAFT_1220401 [Mycena filopes]|nr:hypothetical protein C8R46DRAFT_1220401 [Mycena filopes]